MEALTAIVVLLASLSALAEGPAAFAPSAADLMLAKKSVPNNRNACKLSPVPAKLCGPAGIPNDEFELNDGPVTPDLNRDYKIL